jgi:hypothetical protein
MYKKVFLQLILVLIVFVGGSVVYMYYSASDSCRKLERISDKPDLNQELKTLLIEYLNSKQVRAELNKTAGEVFNVSDFSIPFSFSDTLRKNGFNGVNLQLVIQTDRVDKTFNKPYRILKAGIGYSRAYLMFVVEGVSNQSSNSEKLQLKTGSYVDCRVYE